jgi:N-acetylglucosamine malate deacetylase 1
MGNLIKKLVLGAWRIVVPKGARNSLRLWTLFDVPDRASGMIEEFSGPVVVLAPHPDDEVIGPGGTVARHVAAGAAVTFVILTADANAAARKAESAAAAGVLGVRDLVFLDGVDGGLDDDEEMVRKVAGILEEKKAKIVYLPHLSDHHRDHWSTNRILRKVIDRMPGEVARGLVIRGYEVWSPVLANRMVDISSVVEKKREAIGKFGSQVSLVDYSRTILGLNAYRSMMRLEGKGFAEGFWECTAEEFRSLFDAIELRRKI